MWTGHTIHQIESNSVTKTNIENWLSTQNLQWVITLLRHNMDRSDFRTFIRRKEHIIYLYHSRQSEARSGAKQVEKFSFSSTVS